MVLITDLKQITERFKKSIITIGNFDGLHLGHQELIKRVTERARETGSLSMVVTFRPHPLKILAPEKCPPLISIYEEKIDERIREIIEEGVKNGIFNVGDTFLVGNIILYMLMLDQYL